MTAAITEAVQQVWPVLTSVQQAAGLKAAYAIKDSASFTKDPEAYVKAIGEAVLAQLTPVAWADPVVRHDDKGLSWTRGHFHTVPLYGR